MPIPSFQFLHASDFRLHQPLAGIAETPSHLVDEIVDAPFLAVQQITDTAIQWSVDFVVISGDVLDTRVASPFAYQFFSDQMSRLRDHGISVYCHRTDGTTPRQWPTHVELPDSFSWVSPTTEIIHYRDNQPVAGIVGLEVALARIHRKNGRWAHESRAREGVPGSALGSQTPECANSKTLDSNSVNIGDRQPHDGSNVLDGVFRIALADTLSRLKDTKGDGIDYWAIGNVDGDVSLSINQASGIQGVVQVCRTPQAREPSETGEHGCILIDVDQNGMVDRQPIACDVIRWHVEKLQLTDPMKLDDVLLHLYERASEIQQSSEGRHTLLRWVIDYKGEFNDDPQSLANQLRQQPSLLNELLRELRKEYGQQTPAVWSVDIEFQPVLELPSSWHEEDSILGEFLRVIDRCRNEHELPFDVEIPEIKDVMETPIDEKTLSADQEVLLRRAAMLGVDLLRGARAHAEDSKSNG